MESEHLPLVLSVRMTTEVTEADVTEAEVTEADGGKLTLQLRILQLEVRSRSGR